VSRSSTAIHWVSAVVIHLCMPNYLWADAEVLADAGQAPSEANQAVQVPAKKPGNLSTKTDTELTELTAQWASLNPSQRRELLAEVRGRMVANQQARPVGVPSSTGLRVRVQRQYGRVVRRKSDGSVIVETRVVQVRPQSIDGVPQARVTFGIGFERRSQTRLETRPQTRPQTRPETQPDNSSTVTPPLRHQTQPVPGVTVSQQTAPSAP
jgi:hypothetical protein